MRSSWVDGHSLKRIGGCEAFEEVYRRHSPRAIQLARHHLQSALASDDVVQDVFERFFLAPDRFDARLGTLSTYLRMQVRSRCWDIQRSAASRERREAAQMPPTTAPAEDEAIEALSCAGFALGSRPWIQIYAERSSSHFWRVTRIETSPAFWEFLRELRKGAYEQGSSAFVPRAR